MNLFMLNNMFYYLCIKKNEYGKRMEIGLLENPYLPSTIIYKYVTSLKVNM